MYWLKLFLEIVIGIAAGSFTAAGLFAVINSIQIINRIADVTNTKNIITFYEEIVTWGAILGNAIWILGIHIPLGIVGSVSFGLFSGMYIGLFLVSLAEMVNSFPIFLRKVRIGKGLGVFILSIGLGKAVGHLVYYFFLYP